MQVDRREEDGKMHLIRNLSLTSHKYTNTHIHNAQIHKYTNTLRCKDREAKTNPQD